MKISGKIQRNLKRKSHVISCRQGNDRGTQYRSGIYYHSEEQKVLLFCVILALFNIPTVQTIAQDFIKEAQAKFKDKIVVEVNMAQAPTLLLILVTG